MVVGGRVVVVVGGSVVVVGAVDPGEALGVVVVGGAVRHGDECIGFLDGWRGVMRNDTVPLDLNVEFGAGEARLNLGSSAASCEAAA